MLCLCEVGPNLTIDKSFVYIPWALTLMRWPDDTFSVVGKSFSFSPFYAICRSWAWENQAKGANMWLQSFILKRRGEGVVGRLERLTRSAVFSTSRQCTSCYCRDAQFLKLLWFTDFDVFFFSDTALCAEKNTKKKQQIPWKTNKKSDAASFWFQKSSD